MGKKVKLMEKEKKRFKLSTAQNIIFGFSALIIIGTLLLLLPISSNGKTTVLEALFTATSASCVTGLVVVNTATHWTLFGKLVIITLIQIGGLGVITMTVLFALIFRKRISLSERNAMRDVLASPRLEGVLPLTKFVIKSTVLIELLGAASMSFSFCRKFGFKGIGYSLFHSISAFCNAGFDVLGFKKPFSSLVDYCEDPFINITVMILVVVGGIGFMTWDDIIKHGIHFKKYRIQSKAILIVTLILVLVPALIFYFFELTSIPAVKRVFPALFQSITLRTAGFNTIDFSMLSDNGIVIMIILMLIGAAPASTGGGMKVTTVAVLGAAVMSVFKRKKTIDMYSRRISENTVRNAAAIFFIYLFLFIFGGIIISYVDKIPVLTCLFETSSAIGTVGLTMGITPTLSIVSKSILVVLMFLGRVGGLTFVFATVSGQQRDTGMLPEENITIG